MPRRRRLKAEKLPAAKKEPEPILVDGSNIAYEVRRRDRPDLANVWRVEQALRDLGYRPMTVIDASLRWKLDPEQAQELESKRHNVIQAPAGIPADRTLLEYAQRRNLRVVSNDRFRPYEERYPWIRQSGRRVPYNIIEDQVLLYFHEPGLDPRVVEKRPAPRPPRTPVKTARPIRPPSRERLQRHVQTSGSIPLPPPPKRGREAKPIRRRLPETAVTTGSRRRKGNQARHERVNP